MFCSVATGFDIMGAVYRDQMGTQPRVFDNDISWMSPGVYIPQGSYTMVVGNRYNQMYGQNSTYFKEVRLWSAARTLY